MKTLLLLFSFFLYQSTSAQAPLHIEKWFYGLSLENDPRDLHRQLSSEANMSHAITNTFQRKAPGDSAYVFLGRRNPTAFEGINLDSSTIELTVGASHGETGIVYRGRMKFLRSKYYSTDANAIAALYKLALQDFRKPLKKSQVFKARMNGNEAKGEMIWFTYADEENSYSQVQLSKSFNPLTNIHSLWIQQVRSDKPYREN